MKLFKILPALLFAATTGISFYSFGAETNAEKAEAASNKAGDAVVRTYRNAKNELCQMVDGKAKCVVKEVVNDTKNVANKVETKAKEAKNKVD
jgi:hypothetical protein